MNALQLQARHRVLEKIKSGAYSFEKVRCVLCHEKSDFQLLSEKDRYGLNNTVVICRKCGLVQTNPRLNSNSLNLFYRDDYRALYDGKEQASDVFFRQQYYRGGLLYSYFSSNVKFTDSRKPFILEVGCGAGGILKVFKENGYKVKGIDLGPEYLKYGIEHHQLDLIEGTLKDLKLEQQPDLILYSNVLEHMTDPVEELQSALKILKPDGYLIIEVPGIKNIHMAYRADFMMYLQNAHTYHFSFYSLKAILLRAGFKIIIGDEYVRVIAQPEPNLLSNVNFNSEEFHSILNYLNRIEKVRRFYPFTLRGMKESFISLSLKISDLLGIRGFLRQLRRSVTN